MGRAAVAAPQPMPPTTTPDWVFGNNMGPNALWLMEWLTEAVPLAPDSRVLDMGCGMGITSVFLAEQFGVNVVANDLWIKPTDNWKRFVEAGCADSIIPIHAEAHALPYADGYFDSLLSVDAYHYFGTADHQRAGGLHRAGRCRVPCLRGGEGEALRLRVRHRLRPGSPSRRRPEPDVRTRRSPTCRIRLSRSSSPVTPNPSCRLQMHSTSPSYRPRSSKDRILPIAPCTAR